MRYSAGVDGFRILSGDHIPSGGQTAAAGDADGVEEEYDYQYYDDTPQQSVFVNPHDASHRQVICSNHMYPSFVWFYYIILSSISHDIVN